MGRPSATFEGDSVGARATRGRRRAGSARFCAAERLWAAKRRPCVRLVGAYTLFRAPGRAVRRSRAATAHRCPTKRLPP